MIGPDPDRPAHRLPRGFLGMLALVAAVELTISARRLDFTTVWADDWHLSASAATRKAKGRDVLCFGDSLIKCGVLPRVIEARTGLRAYNLAVNAGTMPSAYFMLRRALESGARPRAIVADFFALMLPDLSGHHVRNYPEMATARDCLDLAWTARDPDFFAATILGKLLPSCKCRFEIRAGIRAAFDGRRASPWPSQSAIWATWKHEDGAQPLHPMTEKWAADPVLVAAVSPDAWAVDRVNAVYCERFLGLAASRGIPVFWLIPPLSTEVRARRDLRGADASYSRFARAALESHPDLTVLDARGSGYDSVHVDAIHIDRRGAAALTADLASVVADRLRGDHTAGRWVELPPFAGRLGRTEPPGKSGN